MTTKQYYIKGKKYEWTEETWNAVKGGRESPFIEEPKDIVCKFKQNGEEFTRVRCWNIVWNWEGDEEYWYFTILEDNIEIPEELIQFYGEKEEMQKEISDSVLMGMLKALDNYALKVDCYELGLPMYGNSTDEMLSIVKEHLGLETELDKKIKAIQAADSSISQEQAKNLIKAGVVK